MTTNRNRPPRGFTIIVGILLLGLIAVAVALVTRQMGYEMKRTRAAYEDAQLRQLLLAGAQDAVARAGSWDADRPAPDHWELEVPASLRHLGASVSMRVSESGPDARQVQIDAHLGRRDATDTLQFSRTDRGWKFAKMAAGQ
ncbi:MAG TPA: hypothetical protein VGI81_03385 [Tepidisphaeraceae bacterium]|jgi:type II secretory pathway pseudopilin PulG